MISLRDILNVSRVECINRRKCAHYYYIQTKIVSLIWLNLKFVKESVMKSRPSLIRILHLQPILFFECINRRKCAHYYYIQTKTVSLILLNLKFVKKSVTKSRLSLMRILHLKPILFVEHLNRRKCVHYCYIQTYDCYSTIWLNLLQIFNWIADILHTYYRECVLELRLRIHIAWSINDGEVGNPLLRQEMWQCLLPPAVMNEKLAKSTQYKLPLHENSKLLIICHSIYSSSPDCLQPNLMFKNLNGNSAASF